ncbi:helix-turn-helix domain-containing protein [Gracilimonas sp. Q87]|uniref:helix-turn-helix domain-containing protein n=1 Tax=Gracilimonas sp. Q87 TaxID=3384766 RepID=UPI00398445EF
MSLGKDLAFIRKKQNLSLEDIQNEIKIPLLTLKSIEDGSIFTDSGETKTYIRSFVRSYAKVLGIEDSEIVQALNELEAGTYSGSLLADTKKPDEVYHEIDNIDSEKSETIDKEEKKDPKSVSGPPRTKPSPATDVHSVNWADMGKKFSSVRQHSNLWVVISFLVILVVALLVTIFYWDSLSSAFSSEEADEPQVETVQPSAPQEDSQIPTAENIPAEDEDPETMNRPQDTPDDAPVTLGDTLTVTVYAAFDKLEPVRVTSDFNWKTNPFWMEQGDAFNFEFSDSLLVDGQYSRMLLLFNGHIIENPRQSYFDQTFNAILITRSVLNQPRYLEPAPAEFPLDIGAPDSTEYVIRF